MVVSHHRDGRMARDADRMSHPVARVAVEDRALLGGLDDKAAERARQRLVARTLARDPGRWQPLQGQLPRSFDGWLGLLVLDGLLVRQLDVAGLRCSELLGPGDLLRPWDDDDEDGGTLLCRAGWRVLEPTRFALLDESFAAEAARWPALT